MKKDLGHGREVQTETIKEKGINGKTMEPRRKISGILERNKLGSGEEYKWQRKSEKPESCMHWDLRDIGPFLPRHLHD